MLTEVTQHAAVNLMGPCGRPCCSSAADAEGSTTPNSTDAVAKDVAAPDTNRGAEGTCSPECTDSGADDAVLEELRLKNALGRGQ